MAPATNLPRPSAREGSGLGAPATTTNTSTAAASTFHTAPPAPAPGTHKTEPFPPFSPELGASGQTADNDRVPPQPASDAWDTEGASAASSSPGALPSPVTSPPYWLSAHARTASSASAESVLPEGAITMLDNEDEDPAGRGRTSRDGGARRGGGGGGRSGGGGTSGGTGSGEGAVTFLGSDRNRACWARSVEVTDYVVVNGSATNIGAFVVWNIRVETLSGSFMNIRKRYSEFDDFRRILTQAFPNFEAAVPELPPKSVISKFRRRFLEKRRAGLQYFLNCILLNPEFSGSPVLKDFLFS